jgi:hypothetical protein
MASVRRLLERKLRRTVKEAKSAVDRPWNRTFLGFTCTKRQCKRRKVSEKALKACKAKVRASTGRTRGRIIRQSVPDLRQRMLGWRAVFGVAEVRSPRRDLDKGIRRRLRSYHSFWHRHSGTLISTAVSFAAVILSASQIYIVKIQKDQEIDLKDKEFTLGYTRSYELAAADREHQFR